MSALTEEEKLQLASFRAAAQQIRESSIIDQAQTIRLVTQPGAAGYVDVFITLLSTEPFRSLAASIRLIYMQGEPAHFFSVSNLVYRHAESPLKTRVAELGAAYRSALRDPDNAIAIHDGASPAQFTAEEVFKVWLHGISFHQNPQLQESVQRLGQTGFEFSRSFQSTALQLAGRALDLDDIVADLIGEPRVPRIGLQP